MLSLREDANLPGKKTRGLARSATGFVPNLTIRAQDAAVPQRLHRNHRSGTLNHITRTRLSDRDSRSQRHFSAPHSLMLSRVAIAFVLLSFATARAADWSAVDSAKAEPRMISVATAHSTLALTVADDDRLYELGYGRPRGLDPAKKFRVTELNLPAGAHSRLGLNNQIIDGTTLMTDGFTSPLRRTLESPFIEFTAEPGQ